MNRTGKSAKKRTLYEIKMYFRVSKNQKQNVDPIK